MNDEKIELRLTEKDVGCWFLTRAGRPAKITEILAGEDTFRFKGIIQNSLSCDTWREDGRWLDDLFSRGRDLVTRAGDKDSLNNLIVAQNFKDL